MPPPKNARLAYLKQRGHTWHLHYPIPVDLRQHYLTSSGTPRTHIDKALNTPDPEEAYRRKLPLMSAIEVEYRVHRRGDRGAEPGTISAAKGFRLDVAEAKRAGDFDLAESIDDVAQDYAERIDDEGGNTPQSGRNATAFLRIAQGGVTLREHFGEWMAAGTLPSRTQSKYRTALEEFADFLGGEPLLSDMNDDNTVRYVDWLNKEARSQRTKKLVPLSFNTKRDRIMALSAFWNTWLRPRKKVTGSSPWSKLKVTDKPTPSDIVWDSIDNTGRPQRRPYFDDADLLAILNTPGPRKTGQLRYPKATLMEVFCLGTLTGARPDEICSLLLEDVRPIAGGYSFNFTDPKNDESVRRIPVIHPLAVGVIKRRIGDRAEPRAQLFAEFRPKEGNDNLAELVGRSLGRHLEKASGLSPGAVPYCTRHTFLTTMGGKRGMLRVAMQRYVGHKPSDITSKHYHTITPAALLEVAELVSYPPLVEERMGVELGIPFGTIGTPQTDAKAGGDSA